MTRMPKGKKNKVSEGGRGRGRGKGAFGRGGKNGGREEGGRISGTEGEKGEGGREGGGGREGIAFELTYFQGPLSALQLPRGEEAHCRQSQGQE